MVVKKKQEEESAYRDHWNPTRELRPVHPQTQIHRHTQVLIAVQHFPPNLVPVDFQRAVEQSTEHLSDVSGVDVSHSERVAHAIQPERDLSWAAKRVEEDGLGVVVRGFVSGHAEEMLLDVSAEAMEVFEVAFGEGAEAEGFLEDVKAASNVKDAVSVEDKIHS